MVSFTEKVMRMLAVDEGIKQWVYTDTTGHKTVGIGFNLDDPHAWKTWQKAKIPENMQSVIYGQTALSYNSIINLLQVTLDQAIADVKKLVPDFDELSEYQRMALINMSFQLGYTALSKFKNTLKAINSKDFKLAKDLALKSLWAKQTPRRAKRVTEMFLL